MTRDAAHLETLAVHAGEPSPRLDGAVVMPTFQSATYLFDGDADGAELRYTRLNNTPNHAATAAKVAALEGGEAALLTASGMAAITSALLAAAPPGSHVLAQECLYGGTHGLLGSAARFGLSATLVSADDPDAWARAIRPETKVFYLETITNPLLDVGRLDEAVAFALQHGLLTIIDNTFATPIGFRPIAMGFDVVVHSATKYLAGHSDVIAGALVSTAEHVERARQVLVTTGGSLDPHACFLLNRGMKTLALRFDAQCRGAGQLARTLAAHPAVERVRHPGLPDDPSHERAKRWLRGPAAMVTFDVAGGGGSAERVLRKLKLAVVAPSLGGVETLVSRPATTSHVGLSPRERAALGLSDATVRVSVGIEHPDDLAADFAQALER